MPRLGSEGFRSSPRVGFLVCCRRAPIGIRSRHSAPRHSRFRTDLGEMLPPRARAYPAPHFFGKLLSRRRWEGAMRTSGLVWLVAAIALSAFCDSSLAQNAGRDAPHYFVANTRPPDAFLALRTHPSSRIGQRITTMPNGTLLRVLQRNDDGWWYVRVVPTGQEGWALSGQGSSTWIVCCAPLGGDADITANTAIRTSIIGFKTPSNNIHCQLQNWSDSGETSAYLRCDVLDMQNPVPPKPENCDGDWGQAFSISRDEPRAQRLCYTDTVMDANLQTLPYGTSWRQGGFECQSKKTGITCINRFGRGFTLSRFSQQFF
jgi:Family of unknown function (DUF6636)/Bacterial SH3 domain